MADRVRGILLDSNILIAHFRGRLNLFSVVKPEEPLFIPLVVLGELRKGAAKSGDPARHHALIDDILQMVAVVHPDNATADSYGALAATLEKAGTPIPENDVWIAAVALELDMPLATRDAHFARVPGLTVITW